MSTEGPDAVFGVDGRELRILKVHGGGAEEDTCDARI
jgi:hypothetical protein